MKIKEARFMSKSEADGNNVLAQEFQQQSNPLDPIIQDAFDYEGNKSDYLNETDI
jgi:hypothetical protein